MAAPLLKSRGSSELRKTYGIAMRHFVCHLCLVSALVSLAGCGSQENTAEDDALSESASGSPGQGNEGQLDTPTTPAYEPTKFSYVKDPNTGMVQLRSPIPQSWDVHEPDAPIYITGPEGLRVYKTDTQQFAWSPDPFMQQSIQQMGQMLSPPATLNEILEQQIKPGAQSQGYRYQGSFEAPGVAGLWQRLFAGMPQTGNRRTVETLATEWETANGTKSMILLIKTATQSPQSMVWQLHTTELEASAAQYETAKSAYLYALGNTELNPEWLAASGQALQSSIRQTREYWDNAAAISRNAHQQRMQAIAARGAAAQSVGKTYSDILDISHQGYLSRDNMNSAGHDRTVQSIQNTSVIGNRETGERYNVDGNSNYYWVNGDGVYIGTEDALFDPRVNELTNDDQWTRFQKEP